MSAKTIIGLSIFGAIALYFLRLKKTVGELNFSIKSAGLSFDGATPVLRLDIRLSNPNNNSFTIKAIVGNLYANNKPVGNVSSYQTLVVPPLGEAVYSLYIRLSLVAIASDIVNVFYGGGVQQQIEFSGTVAIDNITSPLEFEYLLG